jgi:hypothetical protein
MSSHSLTRFPRWTFDITVGGAYIYSPDGGAYFGEIELGRIGDDWFRELNGSAGYLDYPFSAGWSFSLPSEYRGRSADRCFAEFSHEDGRRIVLYFKRPLPREIEAQLSAQLAGENRLENYDGRDEREGQDLDSAAPGRSARGSQWSTEDRFGRLRSEGIEAVTPQFRRSPLKVAA